MSFEELQDRFRSIQSMQDNFLNRVRQFRASGDPSVLPDVQEADRLDDQLQDIVRALTSGETSSDSSPSVSSSRRRSRSSLRQFEVATEPMSGRITPPSLTPSSKGSSASSTPVLSTSVSPRRRRLHSFVITDAPVVVPPTFSDVMKEVISNEQPDDAVSVPSVEEDVVNVVNADDAKPSGDPVNVSDDEIIDLGHEAEDAGDGAAGVRLESPPAHPVLTVSAPLSLESPPREPIVAAPDIPPVQTPATTSPPPPSEPTPVAPTSPVTEPPQVPPTLPDITPDSTAAGRLDWSLFTQLAVAAAPILPASPLPTSPTDELFPTGEVDKSDTEVPPPTEEPVELVYVSPTPPASPPPPSSPPPVVLPSPPSRRQHPVFSPPAASPPHLPTPTRVGRPPVAPSSPLLKSNERRRAAPAMTVESFWKDVRRDREVVEDIVAILDDCVAVHTQFVQDTKSIRVRQFGVIGEYLFRPPKPTTTIPATTTTERQPSGERPASTSRRTSGRCTPNYTPAAGASEGGQGVEAKPLKAKFTELTSAVSTIQRWYKKWAARRRERIANTASLAESEAVDARAALRKRRQERRKDQSPVSGDWMSSLLQPVTPLAAEVPEFVE